MKTYIITAILATLILAGCSSTRKTSDYDDVYYSARKEKKKKEVEQMQTSDPDYYVQNESNNADYKMEEYDAGEYVSYEDEPVYSETETVENPDGTTYITNNYYGPGGYGDYYDYSYSARINRFYYPYSGFNYYSPCYVGFYYDPWYNPYWYGPSLYFGFSWGWFNYGWGYPYYGWGYPYYYPYNSYWHGYNHGYWDGYYASQYWDNGYNSYYYGPRSSRGSSNSQYRSAATNGYYAKGSSTTYSERNRPLLGSGVVAAAPSGRGTTTGRNNEVQTVSNPRNSSVSQTLPANQSVTDKNRPVNAASVTAAGSASAIKTDRNVQNVDSKPVVQEAKPRYTYKKPEAAPSNVNSRYRPGEGIDSRATAQPSQRYSKPDNFNANKSVTRSANTNTNQRSALYSKPKAESSDSYSRPSQSNSRYSQPSSRTESRSFMQPSRSNTKSYSQPSQSGSTYSRPSNVGNSRSSYSRPSSSGINRSSSSGSRSYSTPSRSSSSGSGSRSSSSGGSRGRR